MKLEALAVSGQNGQFERSAPRVLFSGPFTHDLAGDQSWDIGPDGRFLMLRAVSSGRVSVEVALNWIDEVPARLDRSRSSSR